MDPARLAQLGVLAPAYSWPHRTSGLKVVEFHAGGFFDPCIVRSICITWTQSLWKLSSDL